MAPPYAYGDQLEVSAGTGMEMRMSRRRLMVLVLALGLVAHAGPVGAQDPEGGGDLEPFVIEAIEPYGVCDSVARECWVTKDVPRSEMATRPGIFFPDETDIPAGSRVVCVQGQERCTIAVNELTDDALRFLEQVDRVLSAAVEAEPQGAWTISTEATTMACGGLPVGPVPASTSSGRFEQRSDGKLLSSAADGTAGLYLKLGPGLYGNLTVIDEPGLSFTARTYIAMQADDAFSGLAHAVAEDPDVTCTWDIPLHGSRDG